MTDALIITIAAGTTNLLGATVLLVSWVRGQRRDRRQCRRLEQIARQPQFHHGGVIPADCELTLADELAEIVARGRPL
jgi:hypothetical protein